MVSMVFSRANPCLWGFFPSQALQAVLLAWLALSRVSNTTGWKGQQNIGTRKKWGHRCSERDLLSNKVAPSDKDGCKTWFVS